MRDHQVTVKPTPAARRSVGNWEADCSCGGWTAWAPTEQEADKQAAFHTRRTVDEAVA